MSRYIDADKLQLYLNDYALQVVPSEHDDAKTRKWNEIVYMTIDTCMKAVDEQPTADVRENVKGEWIEKKPMNFGKCVNGLGSIFKCSVCGEEISCCTTNYCPNCGADMRGEA